MILAALSLYGAELKESGKITLGYRFFTNTSSALPIKDCQRFKILPSQDVSLLHV